MKTPGQRPRFGEVWAWRGAPRMIVGPAQGRESFFYVVSLTNEGTWVLLGTVWTNDFGKINMPDWELLTEENE